MKCPKDQTEMELVTEAKKAPTKLFYPMKKLNIYVRS